ncbi:hypothetical protein [Staphylococcus gallinarum]|uniref:hypothetical protein n=1 Tax=Staphylococcus gallinarum TaxID=1293 RepID=UPI001E327D18|nr:hypothetical protein [Staphylococcus gallinarum]MCD8786403.1 hypothetical protein [Staphylococcus gallinarum]
MKIQIQGVDSVKFFLKEAEKHAIATASDLIYLDIICTASVNTFRGMNTPQLMIEEYRISDGNDYIKNNLCENDFLFKKIWVKYIFCVCKYSNEIILQ